MLRWMERMVLAGQSGWLKRGVPSSRADSSEGGEKVGLYVEPLDTEMLGMHSSPPPSLLVQKSE